MKIKGQILTDIDDGISIAVRADVSQFSDALGDLQKQSKQFGIAFAGTIKPAIVQGKSFEETLKSLALRLSEMALSSALKPIGNAISGLFQNLVSGSLGATSNIIPFAKGGVVASPTFFGSNQNIGVMGEAGAEAILPLSRGSDGRLGVRASNTSQPVSIVFNVSTPDVAGFRQSEAQISSMLTRTVNRGRRNL